MAASLRALAETDVRDPIPPAQLLPALATPPFVSIPGTFNTRDLGLLPTPPGHPSPIRPGLLYRTGSLDLLHAHPDGQAHLRDTLGIRRIFDLRSVAERTAAPDPDIPGVEAVWLPTEASPDIPLAPFVEGCGEVGYVAMYMEVLARYGEVFREVLRSLRDRPGEAVLFHCTAGRDRTGVLAGLLETLAGDDPKVVQTDFLLSRIGYEPARKQLIEFAVRGSGLGAAATPDDVARCYDVPGFYNVVSLTASCWDMFVDAVDTSYGGFEGYVSQALGFTDEDLSTIRRNLSGRS